LFDFVSTVVLTLAGNGLGIAEGGEMEAQKFNRITTVEPCTNGQSKLFSPAFGNTVLAVVVLVSPFILIVSKF
jgi:hypothetical protein